MEIQVGDVLFFPEARIQGRVSAVGEEAEAILFLRTGLSPEDCKGQSWIHVYWTDAQGEALGDTLETVAGIRDSSCIITRL